MTRDEQARLAERFRGMHKAPPLLLLPNAWDAVSARIFEAAGFGAVATTSGGVAWALGYPDGEKAPWQEVVGATARIARAVRVPVTADIEGGYGDTPNEVAAHVADIIAAGAVGVNIEDGTARHDRPLRPAEEAASRIAAAREAATAAGVPAVINARTDAFRKGEGDTRARRDEAVARARAYLAAGADCIFLFGVDDLDLLSDLVKAIDAPVNVIGRAGMASLEQLERIGVARVTTASGPALSVFGCIREIAAGLRDGDFGKPAAMTRAEAQGLWATRAE